MLFSRPAAPTDAELDDLKRVALVAHPDDETLWGAGLLLRHDWTVICCTVPYHDPVRAEKFKDACAVLGARPVLLGHPERAGLIPIPDLSEYDLILTHNEAGEYGHVQHKELHNAVKVRWPEKMMCFGYGVKPSFTLELTEDEKAKKLQALKCYDHCSPTDRGKPKWRALLDVFEPRFNLWREPYVSNA